MKETIEDRLYRLMCSDCPSARRCHVLCENCDEYEDELRRLEEEESDEKEHDV